MTRCACLYKKAYSLCIYCRSRGHTDSHMTRSVGSLLSVYNAITSQFTSVLICFYKGSFVAAEGEVISSGYELSAQAELM